MRALYDTRPVLSPMAAASGERSRAWLALFYGALAFLVLIPVIAVRYPPLTDYPNHLARSYILLHLPHSALLRQYYRNVMQAQPNLAMDLIIPPLARLVPIQIAGRIFIGLTLLVMAGGCIVLHRILHHRWSSWPAIGFLFVYNRLFLWGFLGYLFALGCALMGAAAWYAVRKQPWPARLAVGTAAATILYLLHLYGLGIYGVILGGFQLTEYWETRHRPWRETLGRWLVFGLQFLPGFYLFLFVSPTSKAAGRIRWGGIWRKLSAPFNVIFDYHLALDVAFLGIVALAALVLLIRGRVVVARAAYASLVLLAVLMFVMPNELFSSYGADRRIPIALALFAVAATDWNGAPLRLRQVCAGVFSLLLAARILLIWQVWTKVQPVYQQFIAAFEQLPRGARLISAAPGLGGALPTPPLFHVDAYAVILRSVFLPSMFAAPHDAGSSIAFAGPYAELKQRTPPVVIWNDTLAALRDPAYAHRHGPFRPSLLKDYDYALAIHENWIPRPARLPASCPVIARGVDFVLVKLPCPAR
ncbi:MAG TPA: hypothetical protein VFN77_05160 [Acetobacteraceae bacterium]|nr:hypothetical protein [Acetobacteraceae bacterium]